MNKQDVIWANETERKIFEKLSHTAKEIGAGCPHASVAGKYDNERISWWTNGFWPGILWHAYRATGDAQFMNIARKCEENLDEVLHGYIHTDHDAGFLWSLSAVADYKLTGNEQSRIRALTAANFLAGRFHLKGRFIRAWNGKPQQGYAIIDCLMNLPLLYWASLELDDRRYADIARAHTETVLAEFIRGDGSVNHIVEFDVDTGEVKSIPQGQGYSPESAWARGSAWAIYGLALGYKYTGEPQYLNAAKRVAHFFIANLPEDNVPYWDFRVPADDNTPTDTSAAMCAACGMLEISSCVKECEKGIYYNNAVKIIKAVTDRFFVPDGSRQELIGGGTGHMPQRQNINAGLIYGDYFYVEAIERLCGKKELFW